MSKHKRKILLRTVSAIILVAIAAAIFGFSSQNVEDSIEESKGVTEKVCEDFYPEFEQKEKPEQEKIVKEFHTPVRKTAHIGLFFTFGFFAFLTAVTFTKINVHWRVLIAFAGSVLYAMSDELHQAFVEGRGPQFLDVLIDSVGIVAAVLLLSLVFSRKKIKAFFGMEEN